MKTAIVLAVLAATPAAASAATFTTTSDACGEGCTTIAVVGKIEVNDDAKFDRLIKNQKIDNALVHLDSPGGSVDAMIGIGYQIRDTGFSTYVPRAATCTSACADIWLAGRKRFLAPNGRLGFHSTGRRTRDGYVSAPDGDMAVMNYYRRLGLPDDAMNYFFAAGPLDMSYVTLRKVRALGIDCDPFPTPEALKAPKSKISIVQVEPKEQPRIAPKPEHKPYKPFADANDPYGGFFPQPQPQPQPVPVPVIHTWNGFPGDESTPPNIGAGAGAAIVIIVLAFIVLELISRRRRAGIIGRNAVRDAMEAQAVGRKAVEEAIGRQAVEEAIGQAVEEAMRQTKSKSPWARIPT
jgi:hypothetical protein